LGSRRWKKASAVWHRSGISFSTAAPAERPTPSMREGRLRLHIGKTFPLTQAPDAHRHIQSRQSTGKLIITP
jgi:NADPH:quinone reductase-like Zn-dependent oxidoreductase